MIFFICANKKTSLAYFTMPGTYPFNYLTQLINISYLLMLSNKYVIKQILQFHTMQCT